MESRSICSQCIRALRTASRGHKAAWRNPSRFNNTNLPPSSKLPFRRSSSRSLSTQALKWQQAAQKQTVRPSQPPPAMPNNAPASTSKPSSQPTPEDVEASNNLSTAEMQRHITSSLTRSKPSLPASMAKSLTRSLPSTASTYLTYGLAESLFKSCCSHTSYTIPQSQRTAILTGTGPPKTLGGEDIGIPDPPLSSDPNTQPTRTFFLGSGPNSLNLLPTFSTWSQSTFLHMYLLTVRLRTLPPSPANTPGSFQNFQQYLLEHFSQSAENHMLLLHTISARSIRNKYLKDLFLQWRGILAAYDEGLVKSDAVLASAVWRNLFKGEEIVDWRKVAMVVGYMRKAIVELGRIEDVRKIPGQLDGPRGLWARSLEGVREMVDAESRGIKEGFME